ncbi:MAG: hypothetical protein M4579_006913 [Chaenotheca gracillima]|nr:MAG: hypothetical protein M4579_006913 [Chaenotheca gracillima]
MEDLFNDFREAQTLESGSLLSSTLIPAPTKEKPGRPRSFFDSSNHHRVRADIHSRVARPLLSGRKLPKDEVKAWVDVYVAFWTALGELNAVENAASYGSEYPAGWAKVYDAWKQMSLALIRGYSGKGGFSAWTVPCLYTAGKYARIFAMRADEQAAREKGDVTYSSGFQDDLVEDIGQNKNLEDAARLINQIFGLCVSDRSPIEESRKWGLYNTTNLLFKTYFKLNSISLSKNILRALKVSTGDMPPLESFPKSHIVTFNYYVGVIHFLEEDYITAENHLTSAWQLCLTTATKNRELILTYLIPCHLLTTHTLPSAKLLAPFPRLQRLFGPLSSCIRRGDLAGFDAAMAAGEDEFVKRRIYLTLERGRDIALRNLLRKVFLVGGFEERKEGQETPVRRTRIPVAEFSAAVKLSSRALPGEQMEDDEVECLLANMIYKNLMKGYISRERGIVVLSGKGIAFPETGV